MKMEVRKRMKCFFLLIQWPYGQIHYQNTAQPEAPATAAIQPIGNEIMEGSWSEVANADGYRVTSLSGEGRKFC